MWRHKSPCWWSRTKAFLSSWNQTQFLFKFYKQMFIDRQHGHLVGCLQTKNSQISNSSIIKMMLPFPICWSSWSPQSMLTVKKSHFSLAQLYFQLTHWTVYWNRSQSTWCWADGRKPPWNSHYQAFRPKESWLYLFCRRRGKFVIHHPVNIVSLQFLKYSDWCLSCHLNLTLLLSKWRAYLQTKIWPQLL